VICSSSWASLSRSRVAAGSPWALSGPAQLDQLADVGQAQPETLRTLNKAHQVNRGVVVAPVLASGPRRGREQPNPFVVADGVGLDADPASEAGHGVRLGGGLGESAHGIEARPWTALQDQARQPGPIDS
jgi:hypothetical protein